MAKHTIGMKQVRPDAIRIDCVCGFVDQAPTETTARLIIGQHLKGVVDDIKPQKSLDDL